MKNSHWQIAGIIALSLLVVAVVSAPAADAEYKLLKEIPVGGEGGWDCLSVDSAAHRLYVSHAAKVVVIDTEKEIVAGEITNTPGVHAIAIAAKLGRVFTSNGRANDVSIVDAKTLQATARVATGENPDVIIFVPQHGEIYAFNGRSKSATIFDAQSGAVVTNLALGGKPEFAAADADAGRVFVNLEDTSEVVAIDSAKHEIVARWPIAPGEEPSGLAFDGKNHRLFLGCGNKLMVMLDSTSGKVLASVPIGDGVDGCAFDPETKLAFASCGSGATIIAREDCDKLTVVQTLATHRGARTMTIDPATHRIYLPAAEYETTTYAPAAGSQRQRPKMVAGSFKVLVFVPGK